jgi:lysophospholipase L1-like esterase
VHVYDSSGRNTLTVTISTGISGELSKLEDDVADLKNQQSDLIGNFCCFGDSITSSEISGIGNKICAALNATNVGDYAHGNAHCSNWHLNGVDQTPVTFDTTRNSNTADNVLSNQIIRLIRNTTTLDAQVKWTHPKAGEQSIPTSVGLGLGNTTQIPDVIYIAISTNDGKVVSGYSENVGGDGQYGGNTGIGDGTPTPVVDDTETVFKQSYSQLTKTSIASALRWAIETLQSAYPNALIFVASPLRTGTNGYSDKQFGEKLTERKRDIIKKVCEFCSVNYIPSNEESGYNELRGGLHPDANWQNKIARYVANKIILVNKQRYLL